MKKVNIAGQMEAIQEYWQPQIAGELNGQYIKLVKLKGEFVSHHHEHEDEMFLVVKGRLVIEFQDHSEVLEHGEFLIIPRGVTHRPVAVEEVEIMLFEPASTLNTGNVENELTVHNPKFLDQA